MKTEQIFLFCEYMALMRFIETKTENYSKKKEKKKIKKANKRNERKIFKLN